MRGLLLLLAALLPGAAAAGSLLADQALGAGLVFRPDAQIEIQNTGGGHALLSIANVNWPCDNREEAAISFGAYDEFQARPQMGSISMIWANNCSRANGYGVMRFNVNTVGQASRIEMRIFGGDQGIDIFGEPSFTGEANPPGARYVRITRTSGVPTIAGKADLVLNGTRDGSGPLYLNAYGTGTTVLSAGGGAVQIGTPLVPYGPNAQVAWLKLIDSTGAVFYVPAWK